MALLRYPGGKAKVKSHILSRIRNFYDRNGFHYEFREPFFGSGAIGTMLISDPRINKIWINDYDPAIAALWTAVLCQSRAICHRISHYFPNIESFFAIKDELLRMGREIDDIVDTGFKKLVIHQISYSGLGTRSGGPLGGKKQISKYDISCRWAPKHVEKEIKRLNRLFQNVTIRFGQCTDFDFSRIVTDKDDCLLYLDPPYFEKGPELYQYYFKYRDHKRLSEMLKETKHPWFLSYDDCDEIRDLYKWAHILDFKMIYTIHKAREKRELLIAPEKRMLDETEEIDIFNDVNGKSPWL